MQPLPLMTNSRGAYHTREVVSAEGLRAQIGTPTRGNVLLVDDDPDLCRILAASLRSGGHNVTALGSAWHVLEYVGSRLLAKRRRSASVPDVVVSDLKMPGVSGFELLRGFRDAGWTVPFLLITATRDEELASEAARLGATATLFKPLDLRALRARVRALIGG